MAAENRSFLPWCRKITNMENLWVQNKKKQSLVKKISTLIIFSRKICGTKVNLKITDTRHEAISHYMCNKRICYVFLRCYLKIILKKNSYFVRKSYYRGYLVKEDWLINLASIQFFNIITLFQRWIFLSTKLYFFLVNIHFAEKEARSMFISCWLCSKSY